MSVEKMYSNITILEILIEKWSRLFGDTVPSDMSMYRARYLKNKSITDEIASQEISSNSVSADEDFTSEEEFTSHTPEVRILNNRKKYNLILPTMLNIAILASYHGTDQFMKYLLSMKKIEGMVRAGSVIYRVCLSKDCLYARSSTRRKNSGNCSAIFNEYCSSSG